MLELIQTTLQGFGFVMVILVIIFVIWMIVEQIQCARIGRDNAIEKKVIERVYRRFDIMESRILKLEEGKK